jgi:hypothetical protein
MTAPEYVLEANDQEVARLLAYAKREAEEVRLAARQAGLAAGGRAVDVGCGPLGATKVFAEIVGESGFVAGVDQSKDALAVARRVLDSIGLERVELVEADVCVSPRSFRYQRKRGLCWLMWSIARSPSIRRLAGWMRGACRKGCDGRTTTGTARRSRRRRGSRSRRHSPIGRCPLHPACRRLADRSRTPGSARKCRDNARERLERCPIDNGCTDSASTTCAETGCARPVEQERRD